jgi:hypothetical protein
MLVYIHIQILYYSSCVAVIYNSDDVQSTATTALLLVHALCDHQVALSK